MTRHSNWDSPAARRYVTGGGFGHRTSVPASKPLTMTNTDEERVRARRACARNAVVWKRSPAELREVLEMLGLV